MVDYHPLPQLLKFTGRKIYIIVSDSYIVAVVLGVWFLSVCGTSMLSLGKQFVHGQNPLLKPALLWICAVSHSTTEIPALPPPLPRTTTCSVLVACFVSY